jgi:kynurenine formamidase
MVLCVWGRAGLRIVDLSTPIDDGMRVYPGDPRTIIYTWASRSLHGYYANLVVMSDHAGTHVDAPAHFVEGGQTVDLVPVEKFVGRGVVVDVSWVDGEVSEEIIRRELSRLGGRIGVGWFVFFYTGYSSRGSGEDYPVLSVDAALMLASRGVNGVGIDAPSIDREPYMVHKLLLERSVVIYENLVNLDKLLGCVGFMFIGLPLKIGGGSASPVRAIAVVEEC